MATIDDIVAANLKREQRHRGLSVSRLSGTEPSVQLIVLVDSGADALMLPINIL